MNPQKNQQIKKTQPKHLPLKAKSKSTGGSLLSGIENFLSRNSTLFFIVACVLSVLFAILSFDVKMSNANDDSMYVEWAWKFSKDMSKMHASNAPLYSLMLSIPIRIFGLKIIMLKSISLIFLIGQLFLLYFTLQKRIPKIALFTLLFFTGLNSSILYFASQTFTECTFMFVQALLIYAFVKLNDKISVGASLKESYLNYLFFGLCMVMIMLLKNIAILILPATLIFFLIDRKLMNAVYVLAGFLVFRLPFEMFSKMYWGSGNQYSNQFQILMQKDPYSASAGYENFSGFISRFFDNCNLYVSKRMFQILGFRDADSVDAQGSVVIITLIICSVALYQIFKNKDKLMLFISVYFLVMLGGTFALLQQQWDQTRFILVYVGLILSVTTTGYYYLLREKSSLVQILLVLVVLVVLGSSFMSTVKKATSNFDVLKENLAGNIYYGYTEDWVNYLRLSEYCADSLPPSSFVACRKAPMSFIYAKGKEFYPVYTVSSSDADTILKTLHDAKVTHILLASLRRNPKENDGNVINTVHRLAYPITQKYPNKLQLVKQIGTVEPAYLYKINN